MPRKLLIFGNGLGMALSPQDFSLTTALAQVWNKPDFLSDEQKHLFGQCIGHEGPPEGENELDILHQVLVHCKSLGQIGQDLNGVHWLSEEGVAFPQITSTYIHKVATQFHLNMHELPQNFEQHLVQFIRDSQSHVATLNYDRLLYSSLIQNDVVKGYSGSLIDGMTDQGFCRSNLERKHGHNFGYYMHLHGSPLFVEQAGRVIKLERHQLTDDRNEASDHIVLTHIKHKPSVIAASDVLSVYWEYLTFALSESQEIILFGYSGADAHLNSLLYPYLASKPLRIIEWSGAGDQGDREQYWRTTLGSNLFNIQVTRFDDITGFTDW